MIVDKIVKRENNNLKNKKLQIKIIRCLVLEGKENKYSIVAQFIDPDDEFLMEVLALVHGPGPKKDRRDTIYGRR